MGLNQMKLAMSCSFGALLLVGLVNCDVYLHNPRGSNNRLNERSANRNNANRVFDSQNNNRGGYNVGVIDENDGGQNEEGEHYHMRHFQSSATGDSLLTIEWTNQHGCGGNEDTDPHQQNCELIMQYLCQEDNLDNNNRDRVRNGGQTQRQQYQRPQSLTEREDQFNSRKNGVNTNLVLQEPFEWYDKCFMKERNRGLFTADQVLNNNNGLGYSASIYTRQNPNGNRNGYECPEERDYYPYFHPSPWKDIAILTDNVTNCEYYQSQSFNTQPKHECVEKWTANDNDRKHYSRWNNRSSCEANGGTWTLLYNYLEKVDATNEANCVQRSGNGVTYMWRVPYDSPDGETPECLVALPAPECLQAPWSRTNHLGNGREGEANNYTWTLPYFPSGDQQRCVLRLRYNISTDDYQPFTTDASFNEDVAAGVESPIEQNPLVDVGAGGSPLRLAINTAQTGRTFQDRTHVFYLTARPDGVTSERIYNLNVRGKRGNIVQVYPAVEYDFFPTDLNLQTSDLVHVQWTGSNTHNNNQPEGDGQAGDAGEGRGGTDRSNIAQMLTRNDNFPLPFSSTTMFEAAEVRWIYHDRTDLTPEDLAIGFATAGFFECRTGCQKNANAGGAVNALLNNAPPSYEGALMSFQPGTYHYMCTRNNNFSNRSQKGSIIVR